MKTLNSRLIIAAAAIAAAAGSASAQSLKADIPFSFRTHAAPMLPGTYVITIEHSNSRPYVIMRNADTGAAAILSQYVDEAPSARSTGTAKLMFECAGRACVLRDIWKGGGAGGFHFTGPRLPRGEDTRIAEVALTSLKAD